MLILSTENKKWYISTRDVENFSGIIFITMAFDMFSRFNGIHMV
jgi:hypothetical protein